MSKKITKEKTEKPKVKKITAAEYEKKVLELAEKGLTSEKIGQQLKLEGIHSKEQNKKIGSRINKVWKQICEQEEKHKMFSK